MIPLPQSLPVGPCVAPVAVLRIHSSAATTVLQVRLSAKAGAIRIPIPWPVSSVPTLSPARPYIAKTRRVILSHRRSSAHLPPAEPISVASLRWSIILPLPPHHPLRRTGRPDHRTRTFRHRHRRQTGRHRREPEGHRRVPQAQALSKLLLKFARFKIIS